MKILLATSEAVPFAKTGGLADVSGALPLELARLGHEPVVIMPAYPQIRKPGLPIEPTGVQFEVPIGTKNVSGTFLKGKLPGSHVPIYFVEQPQYFDRPELYTADGRDYKDNCERYVFFSRAVMESVRLLGLKPDVIHCNDWQTGLIPAYLRLEYAGVPDYECVGSLLTIVVVGGLGLGYTLRATLDLLPRSAEIVVAELASGVRRARSLAAE